MKYLRGGFNVRGINRGLRIIRVVQVSSKMTDRMTDKNSENTTEDQNAIELRHEHLFDGDDDMIQPDSNDYSQRLGEERNNWQNVQEQAIRELVDSNTCSGHICGVTNCNENSEVHCTTCVDHPNFCRAHDENIISCMIMDILIKDYLINLY
ncbi:hypothetical protein O9G_003502 [Rozella allomycis CSF55]|uniref:Uncharacterized protein n=1 Tax=Rozella allomycis (strain CSF55) TaxID=988480 RepID=A0A075AXW6_ROZAC|nr:hypothetical protein O9G_003502 [Rozella allomycis CSF55]|eukprot:EPZ35130.1 hypothetical protein O9G_003502 [Rozella allomycis CSF55]